MKKDSFAECFTGCFRRSKFPTASASIANRLTESETFGDGLTEADEDLEFNSCDAANADDGDFKFSNELDSCEAALAA